MAPPKNKAEPRKKISTDFEYRRIARNKISFADYNPRVIDEGAQKRLRRGLESVGLVGGIVWNETSGNLVSGHQRLRILDKDNGGTDYELTVCVVHMDATKERATNLLFNNYEAQGGWDLEALRKLFVSTPSMDLATAGYEHGDLTRLFGDNVHDVASADQLEAIADKMRETRDQYTEGAERVTERDSPNFYIVLVARSEAERDAFVARHGLPDSTFQGMDTIDEMIVSSHTSDDG